MFPPMVSMETAAVEPLNSRKTLVLFTSVGCMNLNSASTTPLCAVKVFFAETSVVVLVSFSNTLRLDVLGVPEILTVPPASDTVYVEGVLPTEVLLKLVSARTAAAAEADPNVTSASRLAERIDLPSMVPPVAAHPGGEEASQHRP